MCPDDGDDDGDDEGNIDRRSPRHALRIPILPIVDVGAQRDVVRHVADVEAPGHDLARVHWQVEPERFGRPAVEVDADLMRDAISMHSEIIRAMRRRRPDEGRNQGRTQRGHPWPSVAIRGHQPDLALVPVVRVVRVTEDGKAPWHRQEVDVREDEGEDLDADIEPELAVGAHLVHALAEDAVDLVVRRRRVHPVPFCPVLARVALQVELDGTRLVRALWVDVSEGEDLSADDGREEEDADGDAKAHDDERADPREHHEQRVLRDEEPEHRVTRTLGAVRIGGRAHLGNERVRAIRGRAEEGAARRLLRLRELRRRDQRVETFDPVGPFL